MATNKSSLQQPSGGDENVGLAVFGSAGGWEVAIDQTTTTTDVERWFAQIESPGIYLYFAVQSPRVVDQMLDFLTPHANAAARSPGQPPLESAEIVVSKCSEEPISLISDDEFEDRYFLVAETKAGLVLRVTIDGVDLISLVGALRQAREDLDKP